MLYISRRNNKKCQLKACRLLQCGTFKYNMKKLEDYSSVEDLREDLFLDYNELSNGIFNLTNWLECLHLARDKYTF